MVSSPSEHLDIMNAAIAKAIESLRADLEHLPEWEQLCAFSGLAANLRLIAMRADAVELFDQEVKRLSGKHYQTPQDEP